MICENKKLSIAIHNEDGKMVFELKNKLDGKQYLLNGELFTISYYDNPICTSKGLFHTRKSPKKMNSSDFECYEFDGKLNYEYVEANGRQWLVKVSFVAGEEVISQKIELTTTRYLFLDYISASSFDVSNFENLWSRPLVKEQITVDPYITALGQPIYFGAQFVAIASPMGDNKISDNKVLDMRYYFGRFTNTAEMPEVVFGSAKDDRIHTVKSAFYDYVYTFARKPDFYITYNSWYDYMLDIDSKIIKDSFTRIYNSFKQSGLRPLNCYVIDDGWTDYKKHELWAIDTKKFPSKFKDESELTRSFDSHFGLWIGPRGGYSTETVRYARRLRSIGYGLNPKSSDICTGHTKYIKDLGERMLYFMENNNVEYFKLDGFACKACPKRSHGHPVGGDHDLYFYTYLWERWIEVFEKMKQLNPNVFINLTSYAHCSPFFLRYVSAIWMNNANDMGYIGEGSDLDQVLNYRDERYFDLQNNRQLQLPAQYIYNHEPNYGMRNYNPPLPNKSHRTVKFSDAEFEKYLYGCIMRGSGFIELYYSPELMEEGNKYAINAKVLTWAEKNFDIISNSTYFGNKPTDGEIYGYIGVNENKAIVYARNPSKENKQYSLDLSAYTFLDKEYNIKTVYPKNDAKISTNKGNLGMELEGKESIVLEIEYA